jgi:hypothetical protein
MEMDKKEPTGDIVRKFNRIKKIGFFLQNWMKSRMYLANAGNKAAADWVQTKTVAGIRIQNHWTV